MWEVVLELLERWWKPVAILLIVVLAALYGWLLRTERDGARAQVAAFQVVYKTPAAAAAAKQSLQACSTSLTDQNRSIDQWKEAATQAQQAAQEAARKNAAAIASWQAAAAALASYKRTPAIVTKYEKVRVTDDECRIAKGMAQSAWAAARGSVQH